MKHYTFTSESVTEGHPDKVADLISDTIADYIIDNNQSHRAAIETLVTTNKVCVSGEYKSSKNVSKDSLDPIIRKAIEDIGYDQEGFSYKNIDIDITLDQQSNDIALGTDNFGAGDQGMMFGYACTESESYPGLIGTYMPLPSLLSQKLTRRLTEVREKNILPWVRPDGKSQVTIQYDEGGNPMRASTIVIANQHKDLIDETGSVEQEQEYIQHELKKHVIDYVIPESYGLIDSETKIIVNGTGRFVDPGGPYADAGLTGRKIIVDTYGGSAPHGGGAFSGKDPTKVDRSAAYMTRWVAKHVVASGLADKCSIQVAYAIGRDEPVSINVNTDSTGIISDNEIESRVSKVFDFSPKKIIENLELRNPIYFVTASGGHFGRDFNSAGHFTWEKINPEKIEMLRKE